MRAETSDSRTEEALIEGRAVTKVFRDFWGRPKVEAVRGVDITLRQGSVMGLLGPNGAGKTTLIKMILGHLFPTSGTLAVFGRSPSDVKAKNRLGYLPERAAFYKTLTGEEVLHLFGRILGLPRSEVRKRTDQLLDMVGLQGARHRRVGGFSHGMGRRLGLAQALLNDPDLLLLDEPTAGLDPIGCHEIKGLILTLAKRGKTVLMSSHLLPDVQDVCDTIMVMYGGRVQEHGPVNELLAQKDEIEIRVPTVSSETLAEARRVLSRDAGADAVRVSSPTRSLEDYFLSVMSAANERRQETAGAQMGAGVAEYLRDGVDPDEILAELTRSKEQPEPDSAPTRQVDKAALDSLTQPERREAGDQAPGTTAKDKAVDTDYLDKLTKD